MREILLFLAFSGIAWSASGAESVTDLLRSGELRARILIENSPPLYQRAPFVLAVEVATPRWFTRGTRVREFRLKNALVRPVSNFADNQTQQIDGSNWTVQRWRFRVYPRDAGPLEIPRIQVFVSVSGPEGGSREGELSLRIPALTITAPASMPDDGSWVATEKLRVDETWEGRLDSYRPGDAITRHRRFFLTDAPAMLLPASPLPEIPGLSLYESPARIHDETNRGALQGIREESLIVTMEEPGEYTLPALAYPWFNTSTQRAEVLSLPAYHFSVLDPAAISAVDSEQRQDRTAAWAASYWWRVGGIFIIVCGLILGVLTLTPLKKPLQEAFAAFGAYQAYRQSLTEGDYARALRLLHQRVVYRTNHVDLESPFAQEPEALATLRLMLAKAYGKGCETPPRMGCMALWRQTKKGGATPKTVFKLNLNPVD